MSVKGQANDDSKRFPFTIIVKKSEASKKTKVGEKKEVK